MVFEWDEEKNSRNIKKHGISFETASRVFDDPEYLEIPDLTHSNEEDRYIVIGKVEEVLFVVYTEREDRVRIISARLARPIERRQYYGDDSIHTRQQYNRRRKK